MSIFANLFSGANNNAPAATPNQGGQPAGGDQTIQPGSNGTGGQPQMPAQGNGQVNLNPDPSGQGQQPTQANPLDSWKGLFNNDSTQGSDTPQSMRIPQDKLGQVASQLNFAQSIPPEALAALQEGDFSGLADILNAVGRNAYTMALDHSTGVTEHYLNNRLQSEQANYKQQARMSTVDSQLNISDLDPTAQDLFRETARRVASQQPNLNSREVEEQTWSMMQAFSDQFNRQGRQTAAAKPKEIDYDQLGGWEN